MKHALLTRLQSGETLISDGATGTYLQQQGLRPGECPEALNTTTPEVVCRMAAAYFAAGSDLVLTNSFGANVFRLRQYGFGHCVDQFNRLAATLARRDAPAGRLVVGSVGPTGEFAEPIGDLPVEAMRDAFTEQIQALAAGGVDGILVETMTALDEAKLAVRVAREQTNGPVLATMVFTKGKRGWATTMGVRPERAVPALLDAGADVVGANCGNGIVAMVELAQILRQLTAAPLLVHANAGIPENCEGNIVYPETPAMMAPHFLSMQRIGVNVLGGCCGTTPAHIQALSCALRGHQE